MGGERPAFKTAVERARRKRASRRGRALSLSAAVEELKRQSRAPGAGRPGGETAQVEVRGGRCLNCDRELWSVRSGQAVDAERRPGGILAMLTDAELTFSLAGSPTSNSSRSSISATAGCWGWRPSSAGQHPTEGLISPDQLIPEAEASGDIGPLTRWVVMEACRQAGRWSPSIQLGVNGTIHQLRRGEVSKAVADALGGDGLPERPAHARGDRGRHRRPDGVGGLDGHLADGRAAVGGRRRDQLVLVRAVQRHSISTVKIDGSFIAGLEPHARASTGWSSRRSSTWPTRSACPRSSKRVETTAQVEIVRRSVPTPAQGFFFARPMSSEDAVVLARRARKCRSSRAPNRTLVRRVDGTAVRRTLDPRREAAAVDPGVE